MADLRNITFQLVSQTPIITYGHAAWDDSDVANPDVVFNPFTRLWEFQYSAYSQSRNEWSLCFAYAKNLWQTPTLDPNNPALRPNTSGTDGYICCNGSALWLLNGSGVPECRSIYQNEAADGGYLATSTDRINWTRHGKVINPPAGSSNCFDFWVRQIVGSTGYEAFMGSFPTGQTTIPRNFFRSTSPDLLTFSTPVSLGITLPPDHLYNIGEPGGLRQGNLVFVCHDGGPTSAPGPYYGNTIGRQTNLQISLDGGATWSYRTDVLALPTGCNAIFDSCLAIDPAEPEILHYFAASAPGLQAGQGMHSNIYHYFARLPWVATN